MNPEQILVSIVALPPLFFVKIFLLVLLVFYIVFATVCYHQVGLMNRVVEAQISPILRLIALIHLGLSIFTFFLALLIL